MTRHKKLLFTGGSGLLGRELFCLFPEADFPTHKDFDITDFQKMDLYLHSRKFDIIFHAAAFTSPPKIDENPLEALNVNIIGTANVVKLCMKYALKLVYVSTDYVFSGDCGNYGENDNLNPVNKYAWSKLGGECAVRLYDNSLIIRTSFGPEPFPYSKAFTDQWTSRESVKTIAKKIAAILNSKDDIRGIINIGGKRKTVFEYACSLSTEGKQQIGKLSIKDISFKVPADTSLDCSRYEELVKTEKIREIL